MMAEREENFAGPKSSDSDTKFDLTIGYIEDVIIEDEFQLMQNNFMDKFYHEFEDSEENKLCYTDIHKQYTDLIERHISDQLSRLQPGFSMEEFQKQLICRKSELDGEVFEMLVTFSDFLAFKEMMLDYKAEKEGRSIDLSSGFTVTSMSGATNGLGVGGVGFGITGSSLAQCSGAGPSGNQVNILAGDDMMTDDNNTQRRDCGEPMCEGENTPRQDTNGLNPSKSNTHHTDVAMESPR